MNKSKMKNTETTEAVHTHTHRLFSRKRFIQKVTALNSGITLVALIVTIIVLLILAAITLNMLLRRKWNNSKSADSKRKRK